MVAVGVPDRSDSHCSGLEAFYSLDGVLLGASDASYGAVEPLFAVRPRARRRPVERPTPSM